MRRLSLVIMVALLAACSAAPVATPTASAAAQPAMLIPVPSAIASGPSWWDWPDVDFCGLPVKIRYEGQVFGLGGCADLLFDPSSTIRIRVGETLDVHVVVNAPVGTAPPELIYPLPSLATSDVLKVVAVGDGGASGSYLAVGVGAVTLMTSGFCMHGEDETNGPCPLLTVVVVAS